MPHPQAAPTVELSVHIPEHVGIGRWRWVDHEGLTPAGAEPVYRPGELERVLAQYGEAVSVTFGPAGPSRYRIIARGTVTRQHVGLHVWSWEPRLARYAPVHEPLALWDALADDIELQGP